MKNFKECYTLNNGLKIPCLGYGTYNSDDTDSEAIIKLAIEAGYRYFDTASFYGVEDMLGRAIKESGIPREEFFLVSKMWLTEMGSEATKKAFEETCQRLQTTYLDLYLIHWPVRPGATEEEWKQLDLETWTEMESLYENKRVCSIGLSNFLPHHIDNLLNHGRIKPMVNQLEIHPGYTQEATCQYCREKGIQLQAWSPLGRSSVLSHQIIKELAKKYNKSEAQICLRYIVQKAIIPLPKSSSLERMKQNQDVFDFEINQEDMWKIDTMPQEGFSGQHPDLSMPGTKKIGR